MKQELFNQNWQFWSGACPEKKQEITLPHDAMLHEARIPHLAGGEASGYFPGGYYYYEKRWTPPSQLAGQQVELEFDGVYQKSRVYLNDELLGGHIYGYSQFAVDFTDKLRLNQENTIRVEVDNTQIPNSRWYTGSGIYRDVTLLTGDKKHILRDGIKVITNAIQEAAADLTVQVDTTATAGDRIELILQNMGGKEVSYQCKQVESDREEMFRFQVTVDDARLWSEEHPQQYRLQVNLYDGHDLLVDTDQMIFGIRTLQLVPNQGLCINGQVVKLRGACIHHDNGLLGACEYQETVYRRIRILKECGYNAVRLSHNPASRLMLQACDELGMYVMEELTDMWEKSKNNYDYSLYFQENWKDDMKRMVQKVYSHPSVILYSIGNEVYDVTNVAGIETNRQLATYLRTIDDTRPVLNCCHILTNASHPSSKPIAKSKYTPQDQVDPKGEGKPSPLVSSKLVNIVSTFLPNAAAHVTADKFIQGMEQIIEPLDILGINYGTHLTPELKDKYKNHWVIHSETYPARIGKSWEDTLDASNVIGDFMWTGWDYLGETGIGVPQYGRERRMMNKPYPCISGGCGSVNLVGEIEAQGAYTRAVYGCTDIPYIGVRPITHAGQKLKVSAWRGTDAIASWSWSGCEGQRAEIEIYSKGESVELFQDGRSLGVKKLSKAKAVYETIYQPGTLTVKAYDHSRKEIGESSLKTAGKDTRLTVTREATEVPSIRARETEGEIIYLSGAVTDDQGVIKVTESKTITVTIEGPGELLGIGSGNPMAEEEYTGRRCTTYNGTMMAVVRRKKPATQLEESIRVSFQTEDLEAVTIEI